MSRAAAADVERFAWPRVAEEVMAAYEDAVAVPAPVGAVQRAAVAIGARSADLKPRVRPVRMPSLEVRPKARRGPAAVLARRAALLTVSLARFSWPIRR